MKTKKAEKLEQDNEKSLQKVKKKHPHEVYLTKLRYDNNQHILKIFLDAIDAGRSLYGVTLKSFIDVFEAIDHDHVCIFYILNNLISAVPC